MRISDWSSDVCSSDLQRRRFMFYILVKAQRPFEMIIRIDDMGRDIGHLPRLPDLFKDARNHRHGLRLISDLDDCSLSTVRQQAVLGKAYACADQALAVHIGKVGLVDRQSTRMYSSPSCASLFPSSSV